MPIRRLLPCLVASFALTVLARAQTAPSGNGGANPGAAAGGASGAATSPAAANPGTGTNGAGAAAPSDFDKRSLAFRTALHYDASLEAPLNSLVELYQSQGRVDELVNLYRSHITQYPNDAGAKAVLARVLRRLSRPGFLTLVQSAVEAHPASGLLQHLLYEGLREADTPGALPALTAAIENAPRADLADLWLDELLAAGAEGEGRDLASRLLAKRLDAPNQTAALLLALGKRAERFGFSAEAATAALKGLALKPDPETAVDLELLAARAESATGKRAAAAQRLESLLGRLAADYWRRGEILRLRVLVAGGEKERDELIARFRARYEATTPPQEGLVLEFAGLLEAAERRRQAVAVLKQAAADLPESARVEQALIELLDRLGDERAALAFLRERTAAAPDRLDLRYRLVKTLYLVGGKEAPEAFDLLLEKMDAADRPERILDLGRFLARSGLHEESAAQLARFLEAAPERLDVRRELAEEYLAAEQRPDAEAAVAAGVAHVGSAAIENFTDYVQFLIKREFFMAAREALDARLAREPERFDLRLMQAGVLSRIGDAAGALTLHEESRRLADTPARYRQWLEEGLDMHAELDDEEDFFDREQARLTEERAGAATPPSPWVERFFILCDLANDTELNDRVALLLRNALAVPNTPKALQVAWKRLLVKALEKSSDRAAETEQLLIGLVEEDQPKAEEYRLRRGLLYHHSQRPDLARGMMEKIDFKRIEDVDLLKRAPNALAEYGLGQQMRAALEKLTEREPRDLGHWEKRLGVLAAVGDETALREAIRAVLALGGLPLSGESRESLRFHLVDSYWRSAARQLGRGKVTAAVGTRVLELLDAVDREDPGPDDRLWSLWTRSLILARLGDGKGSDAAFSELERLSAEQREAAPENAEPEIAFPDGLALSLAGARRLLKEGSGIAEPSQPLPEGKGPLGSVAVRWAYEVEDGLSLIQVVPLADAVAVLDSRGEVSVLDRATGRLRWRERFFGEAIPARTQGTVTGPGFRSGGGGVVVPQGTSVNVQGGSVVISSSGFSSRPVIISGSYNSSGWGGISSHLGYSFSNLEGVPRVFRMASDGVDRLIIATATTLECRTVDSGALAWVADLGPERVGPRSPLEQMAARPEVRLSVEGDRVLCFDPARGVASAFDLAGGRLLWQRIQPEPREDAADGRNLVFSLNSGAAFAPGRMFVFGRRAEILDSATGELLWSFDGRSPRVFPIALNEVVPEGEVPRRISPEASSSLPVERPGYLDSQASLELREKNLKSFFTYKSSLVAPAVVWSAGRLARRNGCEAWLGGDRLLLMGDDGLRELSLDFPVGASPPVAVSEGAFLGVVGRQAWYLSGTQLVRVTLGETSTDAVRSYSLESIANGKPVEAVLAGSRLYATGLGGVRVINALGGGAVQEIAWPAAVLDYLNHRAPPDVKVAPLQYVWQGVVQNQPGRPSLWMPERPVVKGDELFVVLHEGSLVCLGNQQAPAEAPPVAPAAPPAVPSPAATPPSNPVP